ncbi:MAG: four-carbon acid sugar kinase family protein [Nocardioidaceae bacterium]
MLETERGVRVRVLADDLTGAADAGVAFVDTESRPRLVLDAGAAAWMGTQPIVAADADSRDADVEQSRTQVAALAPGLIWADIAVKKVDSLLRGHLRAELTVLRGLLPDTAMVVAPAFPAVGRTTRGGRLHAHAGVRASIPELLAPLPVMVVELDDVRAGPTTLTALLAEAADRGEIISCDAETDADLASIALAGRRLDRRALWIGSGGLTHALAGRTIPVAGLRLPHAGASRFLAVIGSTSPVAARQADALRSLSSTPVDLPVQTVIAVSASGAGQAHIDRAAARVNPVVRVTGPVDPSAAAAVAAGLAAAVAPAVLRVSLLVLTGGATARAVLLACGLTQLELLGELEPGVVLLATNRSEPAYVITKAGTFGDDHTLLRAVRAVIGGRCDR